MRHVKWRAWRIIGTRTRFRSCAPSCRPQSGCCWNLSRIDANRCYTNWGPLASEFEERLADRFGVGGNSVVSACSGSTALVGAILATAGRATPERPFAILPAMTFVATAIAAEQCGYRVHLVDVAPDDWMLDARALHTHPVLPRAGVVVPVSAYGRPVTHEAWRGFREQTGIPVVIDGAASFEALSDKTTGLLSELPVALSFHATRPSPRAKGDASSPGTLVWPTR